ncbi:MAG: glycosyltransferase family 1 protein [Acidimicrobiales bacterium]
MPAHPPGNPLRLAIDATPLLGARTGVGRFAARLVEGLATDASIAVTAYAVTWRGRGELATLVPPSVRHLDRPMPARPLHHLWRRGFGPGLEWWTGPVDVVHGTNYVVPPARRAKRLVSVHDLTAVHFPEMCTAHTRTFPALIARAIAEGAWVHTDADFVRDEVIEHFGASPERVVTVPLGFDAIPEADASEGRRLAGGDRYIASVGTIEPRKGYPGLVRAFDRLAAHDASVRLVVVGADGWGVDEFRRAIDGAAHRDRIVHLDSIDDRRRAAVIRGATVLAYPSIYEGFGFPPLEAMSADIPVVAAAAGAVPEVVGDAAIVVPVGEDGALADALERAIYDPAVREDLISRGRSRINNYSWADMTRGMIDLYHRMATA